MAGRWLTRAVSILVWAVAANLEAQAVDSEVQRHFIAAQEAQKTGNWEAAAREYSTVLHLKPGIPEVYGDLGLVYYLEGNFGDSAAAFEKAIALEPGLRGADLFLGIDDVKLYDAQRAIPHLKKAVREEPDNKEAISWLCDALWDSGQTTAAIERLRKAVSDSPRDADYLFLLGESYRKSAEREVRKVLASTPLGSPLYHQIFGDLYSMQRDRQKANAHYQRALQLDPNWKEELSGRFGGPDSAYRQAVGDFDHGAFQSAEKQLLLLLAENPEDGKARYLLGRTYENLSLSTLKQLLAAEPDSFRAHQLEAQTYAYQGKNDEALAEYRTVERERPELPGLHFAIGQLLWNGRQTNQALQEFRQELRLNPDHAEANAEIGTILVSEHEPDLAIPYLQKALRLKPDLAMVYEQLGKAFYQRKEFIKAAREFRRGLSADDEGNIHYELGMAYKQMGLLTEARAAFEETRRIKAERLAKVEIEKPATPKP